LSNTNFKTAITTSKTSYPLSADNFISGATNSSIGGNNGLAKGTVLGKASNSNGVNPGPLGPGSSNVYYFL